MEASRYLEPWFEYLCGLQSANWGLVDGNPADDDPDRWSAKHGIAVPLPPIV